MLLVQLDLLSGKRLLSSTKICGTAGNTSSSQEELEEASEGQAPEVHSTDAINTALSDRASCNHHGKWVGLSSAPRGGGKVECLSPEPETLIACCRVRCSLLQDRVCGLVQRTSRWQLGW